MYRSKYIILFKIFNILIESNLIRLNCTLLSKPVKTIYGETTRL
jgi:hypothetical protein